MWWLPSALFALLALVVAISPKAPGSWFDHLLHIFGIGTVSARETALSLWGASAFFSIIAGLLLTRAGIASPVVLTLDAAAIGFAAGLVLIWLGSRPRGRGAGVDD